MGSPPPALIQSLIDGPSLLSGFEWHAQIGSTNDRAADRANDGLPEGYAVVADVQTAGRGRQGRSWSAPAGTSLLASVLLRPPLPPGRWPLLPLLAGLALAETVGPHLPGVEVGVKWPNDLLVDGRKAAGILVEAPGGGAVVVGIGCNVDWSAVDRPPDLAAATSLAEAAGRPVDRWRVLAGLVGVLGNRYAEWCERPLAFLDAYRARCATIGLPVRVDLAAGPALEGVAENVSDDGALQVRTPDGGATAVAAGDVTHVRSPT